MITREKKKEIVNGLIEKLSKTTGLYLVNYRGMTVENSVEFRTVLRDKGVDYQVAKNTLIKHAIDEVGGFELTDEDLTGMSGIAFGYTDPVEPSRVIKNFQDKHKLPQLKAAIIEGQYYEGGKLEDITKLPSREDLIAGIVLSLSSPVSGIVKAVNDPAAGIVNSINAVMRDLGSVIEEVAKKKDAA